MPYVRIDMFRSMLLSRARSSTSLLVLRQVRPSSLCNYEHQLAHAKWRSAAVSPERQFSSENEEGSTTRTVSLPPYMRLRDFAKRLGRVNVNKLLAAIGGKRSKKKIYWDDKETNRSFVFDDMKQVVLPFHCMEKFVKAFWDNDVTVEVQQVEPTLRPLPNVDDAEASALGLVERQAVVAVLGHIDHGKTTLVDALRDANTVDLEEGGITQAIGAWPVTLTNNGEEIQTTFLDTPGHVHFYQMREDSARVATAALLVVACDEPELREQTLESINCLLDMDVPVVVAINKIDLKNARPDHTRALLEENGVLSTPVGGHEPTVVEVSAKEKLNLPALEQAVAHAITQQKLLAYGDDVPAEGIVIEALNTRHQGALLRVVISAGVLRVGQAYNSGFVVGVVKTLYDEFGKEQIKEARPGQVVYVSGSVKRLGLSDVPPLGEPFFVMKDRKQAESLVEYRRMVQELKHTQVSGPPLNLYASSSEEYDETNEDDLHDPQEEDQGMPLILKAESAGKLDALLATLAEMDDVLPIHASVGPPRIKDIEAARGEKIPVVCFGLNVQSQIEKAARKHGVPLMKSMVLHELVYAIRNHRKDW